MLVSVPSRRDPRGRRYSLMALLAIAVLALPRGCAAMLVLPHGRPPLPMMCWPIRGPVPAAQ
ncbi:transposase for IS2404 domain protein [Mycobacterium ulcerans str. Harvey]|uniref:Transposase for IS2404 domain protein n=1 Tax=Mycobacterium ulcerans str. Harvey TaxID=1299332 RepID=A0ABP3ACY1_MYCUL|nr:transposase for IS2404 domain protein [Mycobacterium ulcerans str. Harvey]